MAKSKHDRTSLLNDFTKDVLPELLKKLEKALAEVVNEVPFSREAELEITTGRCEVLTNNAARENAVVTGVLALPPGLLGLISILPDLVSVWRRQARLVADIAAIHGKTSELNQGVMMYCLFNHVSADAMKNILVRGGHRMAVGVGAQTIMRILRMIAGSLAERIAQRTFARWVPLLGAGALAAFSYRDTQRVGRTCMEVFKKSEVKKRRRRGR